MKIPYELEKLMIFIIDKKNQNKKLVGIHVCLPFSPKFVKWGKLNKRKKMMLASINVISVLYSG